MKNLAELHHSPDTKEHHVRMARIYLCQARETVHRDLSFALLQQAAEHRLRAWRMWLTMPRCEKTERQQRELFS